MAQWLRLHALNAASPGLIPGQGTRSHTHAATKSSHATTKTRCNQINKYIFFKKKKRERERKKKSLVCVFLLGLVLPTPSLTLYRGLEP